LPQPTSKFNLASARGIQFRIGATPLTDGLVRPLAHTQGEWRMQTKLRRLAGATTFAVAAVIMAACTDSVVTPSGPDANGAVSSTQSRMQPGAVARSIDPCPGEIVCDVGGGGGGLPPTTYLTAFADRSGPPTHDYYALEFNFKDRNGNQVGTTKEQRWHGDSFALGEVSSVDVGQAVNCGGQVQVEVRRNYANVGWSDFWEPAGSKFILSTQGNQLIQYYDPTTTQWGVIRLSFTGCV
jgi:hypothetical protein